MGKVAPMKRWSSAVLVLVAWGCGGDASPLWLDAQPDTMAPDVELGEPVDDGVCGENLIVRRVVAAPGGVEVVAQVLDRDGAPADWSDARATLSWSGGEATAVVASAWEEAGITGLVVSGRDEAANAMVMALPRGERFVVWRAGAKLELVVEATDDKAHVLRRLDALGEGDGAVPMAQVFEARTALRRLEGVLGPVDRTLVVGGSGATETLTGTVRVEGLRNWDDGADGTALANTIVARRAGLVRLAACVGAGRGERLTVKWGELACDVVMPEGVAGSCDGEVMATVAAGRWPSEASPRTIELVMTEAEAEVAGALGRTNSKEPFGLSVRIGPGVEAVPAVANYRGHTSLECERKSYAVELGDAARVMPGVSSDRFYLISMCRDSGYFNQLFGNRLARVLGLFPLEQEVVRLVAAGEDRGVYLLMEDPEVALKEGMVEPWAVLRRRFDPEDEPVDVDFAVNEVEALASWSALEAVAQTAAADGMAAELGESLALDRYLEWVALNTFLRNEDWVDELFMYSGQEGGSPFWQVMSWDPDDLFSPCHHGGRFAFEDPWRMLYCAEGRLEYGLLRSPELYTRYISILETLMARLDKATLESVMAGVRRDLFAVVTSDETAAAMIELVQSDAAAATASGFKTIVTARMDTMLGEAEASRVRLTERIGTYRSGP